MTLHPIEARLLLRAPRGRRADAANEQEHDATLGAVLIRFYPDRAVVDVLADGADAEGTVLARLNAWVRTRAGHTEATSLPSGGGGL